MATNGDTRKAVPPSHPPGMFIATRFPVNSLQELTLNDDTKVSGRVYCTDESTGSVVLRASLVHTTLASEIRIINSKSIKMSRMLPDEGNGAMDPAPPPAQPLSKIQKKVLEDRERKALKLAEESYRQINQKASPLGQAVFEKLLKACGEVVWTDQTSILVNGNIRVDAPYEPGSEKFVAGKNGNSKKNTLDDGSFDRVKKIVAAAVEEFRSNP